MCMMRLGGIAALATAVLMPAQGMRSLVPTPAEEGMLAWDGISQRIVRVGRQTETALFDGRSWLLQPGSGPPLLGRMVWRSVAGEVVAFGSTFDSRAETWAYDGGVWTRRNSVQPPRRYQFGLVHDSVRDRVVLFGGSDSTLFFGDTWEWDGTTWSQRSTTGPGPRTYPQMSFDALRGVTMLFGGLQTGVVFPADTWEWNGTTWTQRSTPRSPPGRMQASFAYDLFRARAVLTGGILATGSANDIWEYDGANWTQIATTPMPNLSVTTGFVFDEARGECVLVGGATSAATDVWSWNGIRWRSVATPPPQFEPAFGMVAAAEPLQGGILLFGSTFGNATMRHRGGVTTIEPSNIAPVARIGGAMWSDGSNTLLFGGFNSLSGVTFADTWRWTAIGWRPITGTQPSPRQSAAAAFDPVRGKSVLFGGYGAFGPFDDTWEFDGVAWTQRAPAHRPPARSQHALAWSTARGRIVLFGGTATNRSGLDDTWEFDGTDWTNVVTATRPPAFFAAAMHEDPRIGRIVMTTAPPSGSVVQTAVQVWTFDGVDWARLALDEARYVTAQHSVCFDTASSELLVVEGGSILRFDPQNASAHRTGSDCGPLSPSIQPTTYPSLGSADFGVDIARTPPNSIAVLGLSPNAGTAPLFGCTLLLGLPIAAIVAVTDSRSFAHVPVPLPNRLQLLGSEWFFQVAAPRPGSANGIGFSTALRIVVGR